MSIEKHDTTGSAPVRSLPSAPQIPHLQLVTDADKPVRPSANAATPTHPANPEQGFAPRLIAEILATLGNRVEPDWIVPGYIGPGLLTILVQSRK